MKSKKTSLFAYILTILFLIYLVAVFNHRITWKLSLIPAAIFGVAIYESIYEALNINRKKLKGAFFSGLMMLTFIGIFIWGLLTRNDMEYMQNVPYHGEVTSVENLENEVKTIAKNNIWKAEELELEFKEDDSGMAYMIVYRYKWDIDKYKYEFFNCPTSFSEYFSSYSLTIID